MVTDFIKQIQVPRTEKAYLHFARIDKLASFDHVEGLLFLATPDILSGLTTWAFYDTNAFDTVATPFGSGCSSVVTLTVLENQKTVSAVSSASSIRPCVLTLKPIC